MRPTSWKVVAACVLGAGVLGWLILAAVYADLVKLPTYAAVTAGLMAVFELVLARVVFQKVQGGSRGKPMHPLQVARAAALAKASTAAGALLLGLYGGFAVWLLPKRSSLAAAQDDVVVAGLCAGACLVLLVAALLLERACRTPPGTDD
ncbi:MAG: hypothetical protein JWO22_3526 [Frankiales bacterium]|nr:hypothetical protein [Frankiales bacterium]